MLLGSTFNVDGAGVRMASKGSLLMWNSVSPRIHVRLRVCGISCPRDGSWCHTYQSPFLNGVHKKRHRDT